MKPRVPDFVTVSAEDKEYRFPFADVYDEGGFVLSSSFENGALKLFIRADDLPLKSVRLRWNFREDERRSEAVKILGDHWERAYGDLAWRGIEPERVMPWYMLVSNGSDAEDDFSNRFTEGFGVRVQPCAMIFWRYDEGGVTMKADIRCGGDGVILGGRTLEICEIVFGEYRGVSAFEAACRFCAEMCPSPRLPKHPVYGSNNWYYAYGNSSHDEIIGDTKIVAEQCNGLDNIPYMVIDDGWQKNSCNAPWTETNERFPDMKALASEMRALGVRPGLWVRYLANSGSTVAEAKEDWLLSRDKSYLDPSHPEVLDYVRRLTSLFVNEWGYELIKHDYSTFDLFGLWASQMGSGVTRGRWHFCDRSKTSAEIVKNFCLAVREAAGENCVIIGCNTISHIVAGMYELNRTGDDTSGFDWTRTRKMGVNTLAFRLPQNGTFYMADADCVGITGAIPWLLNRQWLEVLSKSGSPLFVSCKPGVLSEEEVRELRGAWRVNSVQKNRARPVDWMENQTPSLWEIDGELVRFNWFADEL